MKPFLMTLALTLALTPIFSQVVQFASSDTLKVTKFIGSDTTVFIPLQISHVCEDSIAKVSVDPDENIYKSFFTADKRNTTIPLDSSVWSAGLSLTSPYTLPFALNFSKNDSLLNSNHVYIIKVKIISPKCATIDADTSSRIVTVHLRNKNELNSSFFNSPGTAARIKYARKVPVYADNEKISLSELNLLVTNTNEVKISIKARAEFHGDLEFSHVQSISSLQQYPKWSVPDIVVADSIHRFLTIDFFSAVRSLLTSAKLSNKPLKAALAIPYNMQTDIPAVLKCLGNLVQTGQVGDEFHFGLTDDAKVKGNLSYIGNDSVTIRSLHLVFEEEGIKDIHVNPVDSPYLRSQSISADPKFYQYWTDESIPLTSHGKIAEMYPNVKLRAKQNERYYVKLSDVINYLPQSYVYSFNHSPGDTDVYLDYTDTFHMATLKALPLVKEVSLRLLNDITSVIGDQSNPVIQGELYMRLLLGQKVHFRSSGIKNLKFFSWIDFWGSMNAYNKSDRYLQLQHDSAGSKYANVLDLVQRPWLAFNANLNLFSLESPSSKLKISLAFLLGLNFIRVGDTVFSSSGDTVTKSTTASSMQASVWGLWLTGRYLASPQFSVHMGLRFLGANLLTNSVKTDYGNKVNADEVQYTTPFVPVARQNWSDHYFLSPYLSLSFYPTAAGRMASYFYVRSMYYWEIKNLNHFFSLQIGYNVSLSEFFNSARQSVVSKYQ